MLKKCGEKDPAHKRLGLHAITISFKHPFTRKQLTFEANVPGCFRGLAGRIEHAGVFRTSHAEPDAHG
jgi:tRNA pseudouridine32 synthase/23S rRNA pseudouridine746 synthase/23S rRNA pseudouridine1911/1915/1917 synthase